MLGFRRTAGVVTLLAVLAIAGSASAVVITFEDLSAGHVYAVGNVFVSSTVPITVSPFAAGPGAAVTVGTSSLAAGAGNELVLANAITGFAFPGVTTGVAVQLDQLASGVSLTVNGQTASVASLSQLNNTFLGGAEVFVPYVSPTGLASLFAIGNVSSFAIGGTSLAMDNMIASWNTPEPATLVLVSMAAVGLIMRRRAA